ncbi:putative SnoaL-like aldol condensation-catalyzing enzyme [Bradyrhizobium japonicum]|uniref:SnoaL-like aldol condensation-catalyzing enzyme n=2 Tax=Nitrobacteraceae TaxID=41294 RepID=A0ABV2S519_BRAJP|nr:nuclear transport factor 2 family protein [Bradyrhizobium japonicum]MCS3501002.1 putative SnoaL-like aldol condensation-catalyzing enzyme [Bradyrhizobium japonicum]MCS3956842.1 putative SnoaL-like aldol condensation-catalyzing enzyme [Bradyrhizobium japonicum]MCS3998591.1 putative SnoaL-like aldol condensation-catalyzing enzyme [Bradyrhizobium japonicum]UQE01886.1 nuclear transport factor 2 family protein [Bradyrhizobium japonicum]WLB22154.1 nuclear transport factor 2 family protein [Bradyr
MPLIVRSVAMIAASILMLSLGNGAALAAGAREEANRAAVLAFYEKGLNQKDADAALAYVGNRYVQHNPNAPDGPDGLRRFIGFLREKFPNSHSEIKRSFVDGDFVILHVRAVREPGSRGRAIVDIFKLENGKIVEHWDVVQDIPENPANNNTMF